MLACYRYINKTPVLAGMVEHSAEYRWRATWPACRLALSAALFSCQDQGKLEYSERGLKSVVLLSARLGSG